MQFNDPALVAEAMHALNEAHLRQQETIHAAQQAVMAAQQREEVVKVQAQSAVFHSANQAKAEVERVQREAGDQLRVLVRLAGR